MNQSSTNESLNLLTLASQMLAKVQENVRQRCVKADINEIWGILNVLNVRPVAIGSSAAEFQQLLRTGYIAEARRIFLNACTTAASPEELNQAFKTMSENLVAAMRMPPPPPPSLSAPPVSIDTTCAVLVMRDPFQNPPNDAAKILGATRVDEFENDGVEPMEVSESDIQTTDYLEGAANDSGMRESAPQSLETPYDDAAVIRFFGGVEQAKEFGFVPASKPKPLTTEALLAEMDSVSPPQSDEVACAERVPDELMPISGDRATSEAVGGYAS